MNAKEYLNNIAQTPKDSYASILQATLTSEWSDSTQIRTIKEQKALPFVDEYEDIEVYLDTISDDMINTSKQYTDFVRIIFSDIHHKQNYKGQMYKIAIDDDAEEENYICYDRINRLAQMAETKVVRCNNVLTWRDENGNIVEIPCYLGTDITSTNNLISKSATIPNTRLIILIQANEYVMKIRKNQRFMFQHSNCFKVEEVNNYMREQGTNGKVTCVKIYVDYSTMLPRDNAELNICDYYDSEYTLTINQDDIKQVNGFIGHLEATVNDSEGNIINDADLVWTTKNDNVVKIDEFGNYELVGEVGSSATINCCLKNNNNVCDEIIVEVVEDYLSEKKIIVTPNELKSLKQGKSQEFKCGVYIEGNKQADEITCVGSGAEEECYEIAETIDGFKVTNKQLSTKRLQLKFSADGCEDVILSVELKGVI